MNGFEKKQTCIQRNAFQKAIWAYQNATQMINRKKADIIRFILVNDIAWNWLSWQMRRPYATSLFEPDMFNIIFRPRALFTLYNDIILYLATIEQKWKKNKYSETQTNRSFVFV